jgi:EAL domain-containing protein (putative c-di-GMP-specific phosphodiesterase class I)
MIPTDGPPKRSDFLARARDTAPGEPFDSPDRVLSAAIGATERWILESRVGTLPGPHRTRVDPIPFMIGRGAGMEMVLQHEHVSKAHAEIYSDGVALRVRDLRSRNGTFLNQQPVTDAALHEDDLLRIGPYEFKLVPEEREVPLAAETMPLNRQIAAMRVKELIVKGAVSVLFQPIVSLESGMPFAYEALGRGTLGGLSESPVELLDVAGALGADAQAELSRLFRRKAVEMVATLSAPPLLFLNTHPADLEHPGLLESLETLRRDAPHVPLVVEVHESALANAALIAWLRSRLAALDIALAYDDFGAGQARLLELAEAPPDYLKFDRRFVTGMDTAPESRQRLVASLVAAARELHARTLAEGVETRGEADACRRAGFVYAQGYYFGRPGPLPGTSTDRSPTAPDASR